jgi:hypothetical protein
VPCFEVPCFEVPCFEVLRLERRYHLGLDPADMRREPLASIAGRGNAVAGVAR